MTTIARADGYFLYHSIGQYPRKAADLNEAMGEFARIWSEPDDAQWLALLQRRGRFVARWAALIGAAEGTVTTAENVTAAVAALLLALPIVFATLVHDLTGRSRAAEVLNDLNCEARWVKFQMLRDRVFLTYSVMAYPFVPAHLHQGLRIVSHLGDSIDDELALKLGGRTTFDGSEEDGTTAT